MDVYDATPAPWSGAIEHAKVTVTEPLGLTLIGTGVVSTVLLSGSGADHEARRFAVENFGSASYGDVAVIAGYVAPIAVPALLYGVGLAARKPELAYHGAAVAQAVVLTFGTTLVLKVATGRPFPLHGGERDAPDRLDHPEYAREWNPFQPARGYAWPSGHASAAFAAAASLSASTADVTVTAASYGFATAISVGMLVGDHHWLSDVVAGALLGQAVGDAVGRGFRARMLGRDGRDARASWRIVPHASFAGSTLVGVTLIGELDGRPTPRAPSRATDQL